MKIYQIPIEKTSAGYISTSFATFGKIHYICKASKKLDALGCVARFMSFKNHRTLMKAFIESQFKYCPLIWMFHSRTANKKINCIHERELRLVYSDHASSFDELPK